MAETPVAQKMNNSTRTSLIFVLVLVIGMGLLMYPSFSNYWNSFHQSRAIMDYTRDVANMTPKEYAELIASAQEYNRRLAETGNLWLPSERDTAAYEAELNFQGNGIMGFISIDKIRVTLPIYHGTSTAVLQTSIGHLEETSLPVGAASFNYKTQVVEDPEEGVHMVLSGHRGLPSAKLFSDLDKLVEGDTFAINILDETYTYQVDQIRVVEPADLSDILVEKGKDYCTLVTCTPYGINTHRLLVRGVRVANAQGIAKVVADALQMDQRVVALVIAVPILIILLIAMLIQTGRAKRHHDLFRLKGVRYAGEKRFERLRKRYSDD